MIVTKASFSPYRLRLRRNWISHSGVLRERRGWLISLQTDQAAGVGDCAPLPSAGTETEAQAQAWIERHGDHFCGREPAALLHRLDHHPDIPPPAVRCGIETALIDLLARAQGMNPARWLNPAAAEEVKVNANLGALNETILDRFDEATGFSVVKLKLGIGPIEHELRLLRGVAEHLPDGVSLRLDANRAWSREEATAWMCAIASLPIESIEEPLAEPDVEVLRQLQERTRIPLALDESLKGMNMDALLRDPPVKRLVLKPMVLGGLKPALELARRAYGANMQVIVTSTLDSAVGVWAAANLAAALGEPGAEQSHGLATSRWLAEDVAPAPEIVNGAITFRTVVSPKPRQAETGNR